MKILVNTANNIEGPEDLAAQVQSVVESALHRFSNRISRVEVHLGDENSHKTGQHDKRCMMEARLKGRQPTAVTHQAATLKDAVDGAVKKLRTSIEKTLGRLREGR